MCAIFRRYRDRRRFTKAFPEATENFSMSRFIPKKDTTQYWRQVKNRRRYYQQTLSTPLPSVSPRSPLRRRGNVKCSTHPSKRTKQTPWKNNFGGNKSSPMKRGCRISPGKSINLDEAPLKMDNRWVERVWSERSTGFWGLIQGELNCWMSSNVNPRQITLLWWNNSNATRVFNYLVQYRYYVVFMLDGAELIIPSYGNMIKLMYFACVLAWFSSIS